MPFKKSYEQKTDFLYQHQFFFSFFDNLTYYQGYKFKSANFYYLVTKSKNQLQYENWRSLLGTNVKCTKSIRMKHKLLGGGFYGKV